MAKTYLGKATHVLFPGGETLGRAWGRARRPAVRFSPALWGSRRAPMSPRGLLPRSCQSSCGLRWGTASPWEEASGCLQGLWALGAGRWGRPASGASTKGDYLGFPELVLNWKWRQQLENCQNSHSDPNPGHTGPTVTGLAELVAGERGWLPSPGARGEGAGFPAWLPHVGPALSLHLLSVCVSRLTANCFSGLSQAT